MVASSRRLVAKVRQSTVLIETRTISFIPKLLTLFFTPIVNIIFNVFAYPIKSDLIFNHAVMISGLPCKWDMILTCIYRDGLFKLAYYQW